MKNSKKIFILGIIAIIGLFFLDNVSAETYNNYSDAFVSCGTGYIDKIPALIPKVISISYTVIQRSHYY